MNVGSPDYPHHICLRFNTCPVPTSKGKGKGKGKGKSKGTKKKGGTTDMNTGELAAKIAKNATKLIAEKIIKAMQSIFKKEGSDE